MSRATDYLRALGVPDEEISRMQAELDQSSAEADHLINHAVDLHRASVEGAALEAVIIRGHIDAYDVERQKSVLIALTSRAGQLAAKVEDLITEKTALQAELALAREAKA